MPINVKCNNCGKEIEIDSWRYKHSKNKRFFCSKHCQSSVMKGENHPNWTGGKPKGVCKQCGKEFIGYPGNPNKYCSVECANKTKEHIPFYIPTEKDKKNISERMKKYPPLSNPESFKKMKETRKKQGSPWNKKEGNGMWTGGPIETYCDNCGKEISLRPSRYAKHNFHFCSEKCRSKFISDENIMSGKNHPNWKGGISFEPYPSEFNEKLKEGIRKRDNRICQYCRIKENIVGNKKIRMAVHHIDGNKKNSSSENLVTLCNSCNTRMEHFDVRPQFEVAQIA